MYINYVNYVGCFNKYLCKIFKIKFIIKKGIGRIYLKGFLDLILLKSLKNIINLIKFNYNNFNYNEFNIFIFIEPYYFIKSDSSIDLSIFFGLISLLNKIKIKNNICLTGSINKLGYILPVNFLHRKFLACYQNNINLFIFSKKNFIKYSLIKKYKLICIKIKSIYDIFNLIKKRLTQG